MSLFSCSTIVVKSEVLFPPRDLFISCELEEMYIRTNKDLAIAYLMATEQLKLCNLSQAKLLEWFEKMQEKIGNEK